MKKQIVSSSKFVFILIVVFFTFFMIPSSPNKNMLVEADTECNESMTDQECLNYLNEQAKKIGNQVSDLEERVSDEKFKQMNLTQQINYLNGQISTRESKIKEIEIDLAKKNVEIRILSSDINELQNNIDLITQEVNTLQDTIGKRISLSYKYTYLTPLEILLSSQNMDALLRESKYLAASRKTDYLLLQDLSTKSQQLKEEEEVLATKKTEVQEKRDSIEVKKKELFGEKQLLASQKATQNDLLTKSEEKEKEYSANLTQLYDRQNEIDAQTTKMVMKMFHEGNLGDGTRVAKGDIIGFQGHGGCAFGSHLHFGITTVSNTQWWRSSVNPYNNHLSASGGYVVSNRGHAPEDSAYRTQGFHQGYAIDMVSLTAGNQLESRYGSCGSTPSTKQCYYVNKGDISCSPGTKGWFPLRGEGAPIYSLYSGTVYYIKDSYGATVALVEHDNEYLSIYAHLR